MRIIFALICWVAICAIAHREQPLGFHKTLRAKADVHLVPYHAVGNLEGTLNSVGTDTMEELMKLWSAGFTSFYPMMALHIEAKGSMTAEPALREGRAQLAPQSRELMPAELERFRSRFGYEPLAVRVALGSYRTPTRTVPLTFYVHETNPIERLTLAQLDAMYCTTRKRGYPEDLGTWGQLGLTGEWKDRRIDLVGVQYPDGVSNNIRLQVCLDGDYKPGIQQQELGGSLSVLTRIVKVVASDPAAIGYGGFHSKQPGTKQVAIAETAEGRYRLGTFEEVTSGKYPLGRYIYILVNRDPKKPLDPLVKEFLKYVLSRDGQQAIEQEGVFLPLPPGVAKQESAKLD